MDHYFEWRQQASPLLKGIALLISAEQGDALATAIGREAAAQPWIPRAATSDLERLVRLALHVERHRLDISGEAVYHGRAQLMAGAAVLLGPDASLECRDAMGLLALLLDKLLRVSGGGRQAKLDGLTITAMEGRALAARSPNTGAVVRGSWRRKVCQQLGYASWLDVVETALWCFWHSDDLPQGEALLGELWRADSRVRLIYGLLAGAFYLADH